MCDGQEAFLGGFPPILTSPQQPETKKGPLGKIYDAISRSYVNALVGILLNLIAAALISVVAYYAVRSAIERQIPSIMRQDNQKTTAPSK
jgi:hypothetical protein